ncbi:ATP-binding protein [Pseudodesulfovibrio sp. zrk46]|uniref:ATP-binding protein n=1 Tax=Pseudodesulfovibrio sp. zrk46 TaxID=2725288 RepID=UPI00144963C2|nr:ATP-binding protein [Pseudodesulfovibrio sp. zrk46]QJB55913.1 response regulator [Pseudodesulfovibrio sp. zrk46]
MFNRLRLKITFGTALILGGFLTLLGMYLINSQKEQLVQNLSDHGHRIAGLAARSSAEYIQRFSFFLMEDQAMSIEQSPNIAFCEIYDENGDSLLQSGNIISEDHEGKNKAHYGEDILVVSRPILASGKLLGSVEIGLRMGSIDRVMAKKTTHMVILFVGFTILVVVVLNIFLNKLITKPVHSLAEGTRRLANRDFVTLDAGTRKDEIGQLTKNFNSMSQALRDLYTNLERKVQERTQELEKANAELRHAADRAREMAERAEAGTLAKSQFLASMSHEIRTPMNAVLGMGEILNGSELTKEQQRCVSVLLQSGNALLNIIEDVLDLSKIEAGEMVFEDAPFNLEASIDKAFKVTAYAGHQKGIDLDYSIASGVPLELHGDALRLQQILINLLGNGVKFTDKGHVLLHVSLASGGQNGHGLMLHFRVQDSGTGIPPDKLESIFDKFTQADASTSRKHGGTGLGLSICRLLCEKLGGSIWIESDWGTGSTVHFCLPYQAHNGELKPLSPLRNKRLMLVDAREYARKTLVARLEAAGARVDLAKSPDAAGELLDKNGWHGIYDGLLICAPMEGDGWEAAPVFLVDQGVPPERIILLRAGNQSQMDNVPGLGGILTKPAFIPEIGAVLTYSKFRPLGHAVGPERVPGSTAGGLTILLVEDSEANSLLIELYLKDSGHKLLMAADGESALEMFRNEPVDVVFMDVEMPGMDGLECTRQIRAWESAKGLEPTPVVALTAHALVEIRTQAQAAGCNDFLTKPVARRDFLEVVDAAFVALHRR